MSTMPISQFLSSVQQDLFKATKKFDSHLHKQIFRLKEYVECYRKKIEVICRFIKSPDFPPGFQRFGTDLKIINQAMMGAENEDVAFNITGNSEIEKNLLAIERIIKLVTKYIGKQENFLEKSNKENNSGGDIGEFLEYINEEASVLFCYRVKDSFEFMDAPEKQAIAQLNRYLLPYLKHEKPPEDLEKMEKSAKPAINSSASTIELFRNLIHLLKQATAVRCIQLLVVAPGSKKIEVKLYAYVDHLPMYDVAHEGGIIAEAVKEKKVVCVNSVYEDPRYDIFDATIKSELVVPILFGKNVYGVLNFEDDHLNRFSREFIDTIQRICSNISEKLNSFQDIYSLKKEQIA